MRNGKKTYFWRIAAIIIFVNISNTGFAQDFNVQHLQDDVARSGGSTSGFIPVNLTNTVELANNNRKTHAGRSNEQNTGLVGRDLAGGRQLTAPNTLNYYRESNSVNTNTRFNSSLWQYTGTPGGDNEMIVRGRYAIELNGTINSTTQSLSGILNANKCIPFITGIMNNVAGSGADSGTALAYLENATTLRVQKGSNGNNVTVYVTVVEFTGSNWTVLHGDSGNDADDNGSITLRNGSDGTGTATNVSAWDQAVIFSHHIGDTGANGVNDAIADNWPIMSPDTGNTQVVSWQFNSNHDSDGTNRHFVHVLNNTGLNVTRFQDTSNASGESTIDISAASLSNISEALIIGNSISSGGGAAYARGWRNYYFKSSTEAAHWSHRNGNTMSHEIQIVDLSNLTNLSNDNCPGTILAVNSGSTCGSLTIGSTFGATQSIPAISCGGNTGNADDDVWYQFVATNADHDITVNAITINDVVLELKEAPCNGNILACSDSTTGSGTEVINATGLTVGQTYYLRVYSYGGAGNEGAFNICVTTPTASVDDCPGITIGVNPDTTCTVSINSDTTGMTQSAAPISCNGFTGNSDDDVWFNFVATATNHDVTVTPTTLNDAVVEFLNGPCDGNTLFCADNTVGSSTEIINASGLTIGNTYYIRVYSWGGSGNEGTFNICVTTPGPYCAPTTNTPENVYIDNVSFLGTLQDISNNSTGYSEGYQDYTGISSIPIQVEGEGVNVYVEANQSARWKAWIDWNNDGLFDDSTEKVYDSGTVITLSTTFGFVIPMGTTAGDYRIRIRNHKRWESPPGNYTWNLDYSACENFSTSGSNNDYGEAEDYSITVEPYCDALISTVTNGDTCGVGTVDLTVTGTDSTTGFKWYDSETGGTLLYDDTASTGTWTTPSISSTTSYWVTAYNSECESWTRTEVVAKFNPVPTLNVTPSSADELVVCGEGSILELSVDGDIDEIYLIDENFESGLGVFYNNQLIDNGATINALTAWQIKTSTFIPSEQVWFPAISSGFGTNQFVISNSDVGFYTVENALETLSSVDTNDFTNLTLSLRMYYSHYLPDGVGGADDYVAIEISTDGSNWSNITSNIIADVGVGTRFSDLTYDLSAYIDEPTLSIRIRFYAVWSDGVAVDDIKLFGDKDITVVDWTTTSTDSVDLFEDAGGVTPYTGGPISTIYAIPSLTQLEAANFDFQIDASLANGCGTVSENFTVNNNSKIWNGSSDLWDTASNWSPTGVPNANSCVIIRDIGSSPKIGAPMPPSPHYAYNLTIKSSGFLELGTQRSLTVTDMINVEAGGLFYVKDSGSLIQINDVTNSGDIYMERSPKFGGGAISNNEYVYWSSPVNDQDVSQISPDANSYMRFQWEPTVAGNGSGNHGEWTSASGNMSLGRGYIVRGLSGTPSNYPISGFPSVNLAPNTALFSGVANNGTISIPIYHSGWNNGSGSYTSPSGNIATELDDNWNLIGNPYPSSISANDFIFANSGIIDDDDSSILGTVWLWPHTSTGSTSNPDPFYDNFNYNYNDSDYTEYNYMGANPPGFNGYIAAGQGFFVLADDSADTSGSDSVTFNNTMRNSSYSNDNFLESNPNWNSIDYNTNSSDEESESDRHRLWLDLITPDNIANTVLIGYATGATNGIDQLYDAYEFAGSDVSFYSFIEENKMSIQGRALPFNDEDIVPLGLKIVQNGSYYIGINSLDGFFEEESQSIFLEDMVNGLVHDLRTSPYTFYSDAGTFDNRFQLRFNSDLLGINDITDNAVTIISAHNKITVNSVRIPVESITIHDLLGRRMISTNSINSLNYSTETSTWSEGPYFVQIHLRDGQRNTQKVIVN